MNRTVLILPFYLVTSIGCSEPESKIGAQLIAPPALADGPQAAKTGAELYETCAVCHQADGKGQGDAFPPLVNSEWVTSSPAYVVSAIQSGLTGPITVAGKTYTSVMPAQAKSWSDEEVANLVNYVRSEQFGNAGLEPVTVEEIAAVRDPARTDAWTADELIAKFGDPLAAKDSTSEASQETAGDSASTGTQPSVESTGDPAKTTETTDGSAGNSDSKSPAEDNSNAAPVADTDPEGAAIPSTDEESASQDSPDVPVAAPESETPEANTPASTPAGETDDKDSQ